jgi:hypothetical protein
MFTTSPEEAAELLSDPAVAHEYCQEKDDSVYRGGGYQLIEGTAYKLKTKRVTESYFY